jgi:hypothetical protein
MGPDMKPFLDLELKDGTRVGDHIGTVRGLVRMAKDWSGGTVMIDGMPAEGMDLEGERKKIMGLMHTKPDEYASASVQSRLFKIQEALNRKNGITEMRRYTSRVRRGWAFGGGTRIALFIFSLYKIQRHRMICIQRWLPARYSPCHRTPGTSL